jgi:hypothetical protein
MYEQHLLICTKAGTTARRSTSFTSHLDFCLYGRYRPPGSQAKSYKSLLLSFACSSSSSFLHPEHNIQLNHTFPLPLYLIQSKLSTHCTTFLLKYKTKSTQKMAPITPIMRMVIQRRGLSIFTRARQIARTVEPHPFERLPITQRAAKADWGKQIKHVGDAAMLYVPPLFLGSRCARGSLRVKFLEMK